MFCSRPSPVVMANVLRRPAAVSFRKVKMDRTNRFAKHLANYTPLKFFTDGRVIVGSLLNIGYPAVQVNAMNLAETFEGSAEFAEPELLLLQVNGWCDGEDVYRKIKELREHLRQAINTFQAESVQVYHDCTGAAPPVDGSLHHRRRITVGVKLSAGELPPST